jgi:hypothetical protein
VSSDDVLGAIRCHSVPFGAGESAMFHLGPVATRLARLAELLDRPSAEHWRQSLEISERARAPKWIAEALAGLEGAH